MKVINENIKKVVTDQVFILGQVKNFPLENLTKQIKLNLPFKVLVYGFSLFMSLYLILQALFIPNQSACVLAL